jgi:putative SbcD/Mre11-related phosphoesterase
VNNIEIDYLERGVLLNDHTFISGDYHLGYSDSIETMTINDEKQEIYRRINSILENNNIERFIINGDIFHEFTPASKKVRELFQEMVSRIEVEGIEMFFVKGNHDESTNSEFPLLVDFENYVKMNFGNKEVVSIHGHKEPEINSDLIILSHLHPIMKINGVEWPSYLYGEDVYNSSDVLILPTFTRYQDGIVISEKVRTEIDFPVVGNSQFGEFKPIVFDGQENETRKFPKLSKISDHFSL